MITVSNKESIRQLELLQTIIDMAASELDLTHVLNEVVRIMGDISKADSVLIYLFDDPLRQLVLRAGSHSARHLGDIKIPVGRGITGWVVKENEPVVIEEKAYLDDRFIRFDVLPEDTFDAFISIPICYKGAPIGVVNIQHMSSQTYASELVELLVAISKQVGGMIANARLYEATKQKAIRFEQLAYLSRQMISKKSLSDVFGLVVTFVCVNNGFDEACILMTNEDRTSLELTSLHETQSSYNLLNQVVIQGVFSEVVQDQRVFLSSEGVVEHPALVSFMTEKALRSVVLVPLIIKDVVIGVLSVFSREKETFSDEEIDILQIVANQTATTIHNSDLYEEVKDVRDQLNARKVIERAKGVLMRQRQINEETAYSQMRKKSMDSGKSMKAVAEAILLIEDMQ